MSELARVIEASVSFKVGGGFLSARQTLRALDSVTLSVRSGAVLGIVGESGCGKSTLARVLLGLLRPDQGRVEFQGQDLGALHAGALRRLRRRMQLIFQDPYSSLNPRVSVGAHIAEPLEIHRPDMTRSEIESRVAELLEQVGLTPHVAGRLPSEFSGGQRQRVAIARALAVEPELIVADEPVSALDVSIQAQIVRLLMELRSKRGLTFVIISHDLRVIRHMCDDVVVLYQGRIVESRPRAAFYDRPLHPYSRALLSAAPTGVRHRRVSIASETMPGLPQSSGCPFFGRCSVYPTLSSALKERCREQRPHLRPVSEAEGSVACHVAE